MMVISLDVERHSIEGHQFPSDKRHFLACDGDGLATVEGDGIVTV